MYLLPAIDILGGKVVRLAKGDYNRVTVYNDSPLEQALAFENAGATWIHVVDLDGARTGEPSNIGIIEQIAQKTKLKVEVGGGVRSLETLDRLVDSGASRVVMGTVLVKNRDLAQKAVDRYPDILCAGIDARNGEVAVDGWEKGSGVSAFELATQMALMGYRHMVYTDISRDGMQTGVDPQAYANMAQVFGHPVTASGGIASMMDLENLGKVALSIEGIITGRAVYEGSIDVAAAVKRCDELTQAALAAASNPQGKSCEGCTAALH